MLASSSDLRIYIAALRVARDLDSDSDGIVIDKFGLIYMHDN